MKNYFAFLLFIYFCSFLVTVGLGVFIYHEKFLNKPQTLDDRYASSESEGGISNETSSRRISHIDCSMFDSGPRVNWYLFLSTLCYFITKKIVTDTNQTVFASGKIYSISVFLRNYLKFKSKPFTFLFLYLKFLMCTFKTAIT